MPGSTEAQLSRRGERAKLSLRGEAQDAVDNLRRNIRESRDPAQIKRHKALLNQYLRRYGHLGVR